MAIETRTAREIAEARSRAARIARLRRRLDLGMQLKVPDIYVLAAVLKGILDLLEDEL